MLRSMMKNQPSHRPETDHAETESEDWNALAARIQQLAHRRSRSLLTDPDDDAFDRGARSLRTLMSAAEVAARMKRDAEKERETDEQTAGRHDFTEEDIETAYRRIFNTVERIEREDADAGKGNGAQGGAPASGAGEGICAEAVGGERS